MRFILLSVFLSVYLLFPSVIRGNDYVDAWAQEDTIKISRDSLLRIIHLKDSMLLQASLDSLATNNLLELVWWEKDSLQVDLMNLKYVQHLDSIYEEKQDSLWAEFNRNNRWALRDSLFKIDEDSVRSELGLLLEVVYSDSARSQDPQKLRGLWDRLIYHMGNDSTYFWIHYADNDSIGVVLRDGHEVRNAIFLTNQQADSAKVYLHGKGKHGLHMWVDDNLFLTHVLKRTANPEEIMVDYKDVSIIKIPKKKLPKAPPQYWSTNGKIVFQLNQWAYSNWAKGGDNRLTFLMDTKGGAKYVKDKMSWTSSYWYRFGLLKSEGQNLFKNIDLLKIKSDFRHKAFKKLSYSAVGHFDSQLFPGYKSPNDSLPNSKFMSPATMNIGVGMVYVPNKNLSINLSPISGKFTFVLDTITVNQKKYGLKEGQRVKGEPGATLNINYKRLLWKNINMTTGLRLFSNYVNNPQNIDVDWTTQFSLKVNKYVSTTLFFYIKYDDDTIIPFYEWIDGVKTKVGEGKRIQFQETFGITFTYIL
ncbi:MAG: DUF3078 domain-containing protein [Bacteroidota bacterium]|nr:DUF3078 domain-containing protein [Bacteroidota bacterium]